MAEEQTPDMLGKTDALASTKSHSKAVPHRINLCKHRKGERKMRFIAIALLALLVCTAAMAGPAATTGTSVISGAEQSYWYTYDSSWNVLDGAGAPLGETRIDVTATVPYFASEWLEGSSIDFTLKTAVAGSQLRSDGLTNIAECNFPFYIYLAATPGCPDIDLMKWDNAGGFAYSDGAGSNTMAIKWFYSIDGTVSPAVVDGAGAGTVKGPSFSSGPHTFEWLVDLTPNTNQKPGAYSLDPSIVIAPGL